jgi:hypothetical protein
MFEIELNNRQVLQVKQGLISEYGRLLIEDYIGQQQADKHEWRLSNPPYYWRNWLPSLPDDWEWVWTATGKYRGKFATRVGQYYWKEYKLKCPPHFLEMVGNLAREHSVDLQNFEFDFTDRIDWDHGDFGDEGSCFWEDHDEARTALNRCENAYAMRFYNDGMGCGRVLVLSLSSMDSFVLFNAYGISLAKAAFILSILTKGQYAKVDVYNFGKENGLIWINGGTGYIVAPEGSNLLKKTEIDLKIYGDTCYNCGEFIGEDDSSYPYGETVVCGMCYDLWYTTCTYCSDTCQSDSAYAIDPDTVLCGFCFNRNFKECVECGETLKLSHPTDVCKKCEVTATEET